MVSAIERFHCISHDDGFKTSTAYKSGIKSPILAEKANSYVKSVLQTPKFEFQILEIPLMYFEQHYPLQKSEKLVHENF